MASIAAVIQARTTSSRLPGKVLEKLGGTTVIDAVVSRAAASAGVERVVVAVPWGDDLLLAHLRRAGIMTTTGPEDDVLERYCIAGDRLGVDALVRITADCPLLDPAVVSRLVVGFQDGGVDYGTTSGYPRGCGDAEVIATEALFRTRAETTDPRHREHVGTYAAEQPSFTRLIMEAPASLHRPDLRVCIDEMDDLVLVRSVVAELGLTDVSPTTADIVTLLSARPDLVKLNQHVRQRS